MKNSHLVFKAFVPKENGGEGFCIWCKNKLPKNKAHILSKRIIKSETIHNILKKCVCVRCNEAISENLEDFLFKKTPISFIADTVFEKSAKSLKWVPNYFWNDKLNTWFIYIRDNAIKEFDHAIPHQLLLSLQNELLVFIHKWGDESHFSKTKKLIDDVKRNLIEKKYTTHVSIKYPDNFLPRGFYYKGNLILTARTDGEINDLIQKVINYSGEDGEFGVDKEGSIINSEKYQIKFEWIPKIYFDYCVKIAFEFLAMIRGADFCIQEGFDDLRSTVLFKNNFKSLNVLYSEDADGKRFDSKLVPEGWISYYNGIDEDVLIYPLKDDETNNHTIFIYELSNGLICATVKLFNIQTAQIILGKNKGDGYRESYTILYNTQNGVISYYRLINDEKKAEEVIREAKEHKVI